MSRKPSKAPGAPNPEADQLAEQVRQARYAIQDLKQARKELDEYKAQAIETVARMMTDEQLQVVIHTILNNKLVAIMADLQKEMDELKGALKQRVQNLYDALMDTSTGLSIPLVANSIRLAEYIEKNGPGDYAIEVAVDASVPAAVTGKDKGMLFNPSLTRSSYLLEKEE